MLNPVKVTGGSSPQFQDRAERLFSKQGTSGRIAEKFYRRITKGRPVPDRPGASLKIEPLVKSFEIKNIRAV